MDPYRPDPEIERVLKLVLPSLNEGLKSAFEYVFERSKYFVSFQDLVSILLSKLEEKMRLPDPVKAKLYEELERIYNNSVQETISEIFQEGFVDFRSPDTRSIEYALRLHDFYLGKFFQGDKQVRKRVLDWFSEYYLREGNPIGRGQKGVKEFLRQFGHYIKPQVEWKARQIIDTSVNFLRNAGKIKTLQKARIEHYRWDATNDRLTCKICRSYDGRIFKTAEAVRILDILETTQDPELIRELKPFVNKPVKGPSDSLPTKLPPIHPHCRCRVVAHYLEEALPVSVEPVGRGTMEQRELLEEFRALKSEEITNKVKAHLGSSWERGEEHQKKNVFLHFEKHAKKLGVNSIEEYKALAYKVIKEPDHVFVQKEPNGERVYLFVKGDLVAISSDDSLLVKSLYKLKFPIEEWLKDAEGRGRATIKIL